MKTPLPKKEVQEKISEIFKNNPSPKEIKKAKKLAMSKNIKLGPLRKLFCKKCSILFNPTDSQVKIKDKMKIIKCEKCGYIARYRLKE